MTRKGLPRSALAQVDKLIKKEQALNTEVSCVLALLGGEWEVECQVWVRGPSS